MSEYDFEKLDHKEFERFANALCAEYVTRGTNVFGAGTDGGREATYEGEMNYPLGEGIKSWNGYLVVQCKQKEKVGASLKVDTDWAISQLDEEMKMYGPKAKVKRRLPEYFLFVTNVELSAKLNSGGKDKFLKRLNHWKEALKIKEVGLWDRDKLTNLLDSQQEIRKRFSLLLPNDLIDAATKFFLIQQPGIDVTTTIGLFLQNELLEDQYVSLKQAGHETDEEPMLSRVFVDLRANGLDKNNEAKDFYAAAEIQRVADRSIAPSALAKEKRAQRLETLVTTAEGSQGILDGEDIGPSYLEAINNKNIDINWQDPSRFVVIGGPGQGKSTLVQYLAQRQRASLLSSAPFAAYQDRAKRAIAAIAEEAEEAGCGLPKHARLPFRIVLEKFANDIAKGDVTTVMDYISETIRTISGQPFTRSNAEHLLSKVPLLIIFDGLDEVPAVSNRKEMLKTIRRFISELIAKDADALIVATTRPQGYTGEFDKEEYNHLTLKTLSKKEALFYARKLVKAKYPDRVALQKDIIQRLETAAVEKAIERLMESPLQVTIMATLVETVHKLPRERYVLFQMYYDIIYKREQGRSRTLSGVLHLYQSRIEILHDSIGLRLQVDGETARDADSSATQQSRLSRAELKKLIRSFLEKDGHEGPELDQLTDQFMFVALDRLVFIVPFQEDSYGFEVRSLQEFSAARELTREGDIESIRKRLRAITPIPYWRNTALFAIGRVFKQGDSWANMIDHLCVELNYDESDFILFQTLAGSRLALDILEEGIGEERPVYRKGFLDKSLHLLTLPDISLAERLATLYEPKYERLFTKGAEAAIGTIGTEIRLGLFILLANIAARKDNAQWAKLLLQQLWPKNTEDARYLFEKTFSLLSWDDWQIRSLIQVVRESPVSWAIHKLRNIPNVQWLVDVQQLDKSQDGDVDLFVSHPIVDAEGNQIEESWQNYSSEFRYIFSLNQYSQEALARIAEAKPTHMSWLPYTSASNFLLQPSAATLADGLEGIVQSPYYEYKRNYFADIPWQMLLILNNANSKEEILALAQKIRKGQLGDTQEWLAAESRWLSEGFRVSDFQVFSDEEWPFTPEIAVRGVQPFGTTTSGYVKTPDDSAARAILEAFFTATCSRARGSIAASFFFLRRCTHNKEAAFTLPLTTIDELTQKASWGMQATPVASLLERNLDWPNSIEKLDSIGKRVNFQKNLFGNELLSVDEGKVLLEGLASLLVFKPIRSGVLRFMAAYIVTNDLLIDDVLLPTSFDSLPPDGAQSLIALHLFSLTSSVPVNILAEHIGRLWEFKGIESSEAEIPIIISYLLDKETIPAHSVQVLSHLLAYPIVGIDTKRNIIEMLINQTENRRSGFGGTNSEKNVGFAV